jgi:hypothetical protein
MSTQHEFDRRMEHLGQLLEQLPERVPESALAPARDLLNAVLAVHQSALAQLLELAQTFERESGPAQPGLVQRLASHPSVAAVLALHDLHPEALPARINRALGEAQQAAPGSARALLRSATSERVEVHIEQPAGAAREAEAAQARQLRRALEQALSRAVPEAEVWLTGGEPVLESGLLPVARLTVKARGVAP